MREAKLKAQLRGAARFLSYGAKTFAVHDRNPSCTRATVRAGSSGAPGAERRWPLGSVDALPTGERGLWESTT